MLELKTIFDILYDRIDKNIKNKIKINTSQLKHELTQILYLSYIKPEIIPEGLVQLIVLQWIYKIKV